MLDGTLLGVVSLVCKEFVGRKISVHEFQLGCVIEIDSVRSWLWEWGLLIFKFLSFWTLKQESRRPSHPPREHNAQLRCCWRSRCLVEFHCRRWPSWVQVRPLRAHSSGCFADENLTFLGTTDSRVLSRHPEIMRLETWVIYRLFSWHFWSSPVANRILF